MIADVVAGREPGEPHNADGVHDFAVGGGPRYPTQYVGQIFLLNGRVRTTPTADVPVTQLPQGDVLGVVQSFVDTNFGNGNNALVSLGDPNPRNLLLVGTPIANYSAGGAAAVLLTGTDGGPLQITEVARWAGNLATKQSYGRDVADIGDVNGDGVDDAAILEQGDGSAVNRGRILIVSGAGLLDGFSSNDVIQQIDDPKLTFSPGMSFLGDYDHDGRGDLAVTMSGPTPGFVRIYSVPEPTSVAAAAFASAALLLRRRRRCRHGEPSR